jgi:hypothetical protein
MALIKSQLSTAPATIYTSANETVITVGYFCNTSDSVDTSIDVYLVPAGDSPDSSNIIYKNVPLVAGNTYILDTEKIIFNDGDSIQASATTGSIVTSMISYTGL